MTPYRIMLIHPGATFSVADVWSGLKYGLEAQGCEVSTYRLDTTLIFYSMVLEIAERNGLVKAGLNPTAYAASPSVAVAMAKRPDAVIAVSAHNWHMSAPITIRLADAWEQLQGLKTESALEEEAKQQVIATLRESGLHRKLDIPVAAYFTESPYFEIEHQMAPIYDCIFTNERRAVDYFAHPNVHYLPHAYNPCVHQPGAADEEKQSDVFYVGTGFPERRVLLDGVNWEGVNFVRKGFLWKDGDTPDNVTQAEIVPNEEAAAWYRSAAICLNHHRTTTTFHGGGHIPPGVAESVNPRAYELAACRAFQLSDDSRPEFFDLFRDAAVTYRAGDSGDLERKIRYWLDRPERRAETAQAQHEAILPHSWVNRAGDVLNVLFG